jgi:hypothetical protein
MSAEPHELLGAPELRLCFAIAADLGTGPCLALEGSPPPPEEARRLVADEGDPIGGDVLDDRWAFAP